MLASSELCAVLGSGVDNTNHTAVRSFIREACTAGLSLLLITPGSKVPFDGRTAKKKLADDKAAQEAAREAGRRDWARVKSASGLALATSDAQTLLKKGGYLDTYIAAFGAECAVNLGAEVGGSRLVVVDCDTEPQKNRFIEEACTDAGIDPDYSLTPTVISPGTQDADGNWIHTPGNGHFWFTLPEGLELPTNTGAMTWGGEDGFAVLWDRRYVLIPPSTRREGRYELAGRDYEAPSWLIRAIVNHSAARESRYSDNTERDDDLASEIDQWAEEVSWAEILEPLGWSECARPDNCGCPVWTAPGEHASPKSATAHDAGCTLGRYTEVNAPLHIWTDHDIEPFDTYVAESKSKTLSKLQAVAHSQYGGSIGKAMDELDLATTLTSIERDEGLSKANLADDVEHHDPELDFDLAGTAPQPPANEEDDEHNPDVFDTGLAGVPVIAPFTHWRHMPPPEFVIEGLIEHTGLSAIIGPPGVGKSSVCLDMACHIATGKAWQGRKTLKTKVLYLPGEGLSGAVQRIKAWGFEHGVSDEALDEGLRMGNSIIGLKASPEAWGMIGDYINREKIGLVIFDTFARMAAGVDENSATEVGLAVKRFDRLRQLTNAGVLVVHHTSKGNPTSARGSSALMGALDSELLIAEGLWALGAEQLPSGKPIQLSTTKQKNAEQLDEPISLLMRSCLEHTAPYITGPSGTTDPLAGDVILASPVDEPVLETAIRIAIFADDFPEQGVTRIEAVAGVRPDAYTARRRDGAKAWKQKVSLAVDTGLRFGLLETVSGLRTGSRYVRGPVDATTARAAHAAEVMGVGEEEE